MDLGYPQGEHIIYPPQRELLEKLIVEANFDQNFPLVEFYSYCNGIDLPDVHNAYFIYQIETILHGLRSGEPTQIKDDKPDLTNIVVFGSDGGGGRLALVRDAPHKVLFLPDEGAVYNSVFNCSSVSCKTVASDFPSFLMRLRSDIEAFIEDRQDWNYIGS